MSHHRKTVTAPGAPEAAGPYSHAVVFNGLVFCSGQVHIDPGTGQLTGDTPGEQTARCLDNLALVCEAAGTSLANAVRMGIYVTDMGTFKEVNEAYAGYFPSGPPARSTIAVSALPLGAQVEIDAVVALGD